MASDCRAMHLAVSCVYRSHFLTPIGWSLNRENIMANPTETAWAQGYKTGLNGKPDTLCPFKKGALMQAWMQGWENGAKSRSEKQA